MNVNLTNPALLPLLALAAVPLLLHLFARARPPRYRFSSTAFIQRLVRHTLRLRRPRDWLLLALRTLVCACLALLFLKPVLLAPGRTPAPFRPRNVVVVVDASASMAYVEGPQTRFASACAEAAEVLGGLGPGDRSDVVWLRANPAAVFPALGINHGYLRGLLQQAQVTSEAGHPAAAIRLATDLLHDADGSREIVLVSDFQATAWKGLHPELPASFDLTAIRVGHGAGSNLAVTHLGAEPPLPLAGEEFAVFAEVHNYSAQPRRVSVYLEVDEARRRQEVLVPAWDKASAVFQLTRPSAGDTLLAAAIDPDEFGGDNRRWSVLTVRPNLRVGLAARAEGAARPWERALRALDWVQLERLTLADPERVAEHDTLVLADWAGDQPETVRQFLTQGGTVIAAPAPDTAVEATWQLLAPQQRDGARWARARTETGWSLRAEAAADPVFNLFRDGDFGDPAAGHFRTRLEAPGLAVPPEGSPLLNYADGVPALLKFTTGGTLLVWNLALGDGDSDWARRAEFLPFVGELLLTNRRRAPERRTDLAPGEALAWHFPGEVLDAEVVLADPQGAAVQLHRQAQGAGTGLVSDPAATLGPYRWQHRDRGLGFDTVNFPAVESDLRVLAAEAVASLGGAALESGGQVRALREGLPLWPLLLALGAGLAMVELAVLAWPERA